MEAFSHIQSYYMSGWTGQNSPTFPLLNQTVTFNFHGKIKQNSPFLNASLSNFALSAFFFNFN